MKIKTLILLIIFTTACGRPAEVSSQEDGDKNKAGQSKTPGEYITSHRLPDKLDFCGEPLPLNIPEVKERAEREFFLLLQQPGQIVLYLKRSGRYFPMYERLLKENNMPDDLKYLSVAESALYQARSHKGAIGLWQFMKATARLMGLHVSEYVDERRHPEKSCLAAIKYLKQGYAAHDSWILAAAGYNMGHGNVRKTMAFQSGDDYFDLFLNAETSRFIFRIAAIKEIMSSPKKYGFNLTMEDYYKPDNVRIVKWKKAIPNLAQWAADHGSTYKEVKILNPWILKRQLRAPLNGKEYEIALPAE